jgi:LacI family transcriptional regulator
MKITIQDVAKEAGVSITTVSRVINNNYPVKEETRKRIEKAIQKLDYRPNVLARGLIHNKTDTIGVIVPSITNLFFPSVVKGIENVLREKEYTIYLCDTDDKEEEETRYIKSLLTRQVDGIIAIDPRTKNIESGFYEKIGKEVPLVCINGYNKGINCNFVLNDQETGTIEAVEYLINLGHRDIAFVRGHKSYSYDLKEKVYKEVLKKYGCNEKEQIIDIGAGNRNDTMEMTMKKIKPILEKSKYPTAFFCCNDLMALGVVNACKKVGLHVPDDVSVIGFDNIVISSLIEPKITTVDQNMYALGENAAKVLIENIEKKNINTQKIILNTKLIVRESCKSVEVK